VPEPDPEPNPEPAPVPPAGDGSVLGAVSEDDDPLETTSGRTSSPMVHVPCATDGTPPTAEQSADVNGSAADADPTPSASEPLTKAPTTLDNK
jgi:hypothetical protein